MQAGVGHDRQREARAGLSFQRGALCAEVVTVGGDTWAARQSRCEVSEGCWCLRKLGA